MFQKVDKFVFNSFGVNTYFLNDSSGKCLIIDPACENRHEENILSNYIKDNHLEPVAMVNTHFHIDHIIGNTYVCNTYNLKPICHKSCRVFWETAVQTGMAYGIKVDNPIVPQHFIEEGDIIRFGDSSVQVLYTPGHANGSICLVNHADRYVLAGDVLFRDSIGRTDLPTGNFDVLFGSITTKLFTLPDNYVVYPGHGPSTTIGYEKLNNPFL